MTPATVLEVPAAALTSALRRSPRSLNRCARHGLPADVHVDLSILAPPKQRRPLYRYIFPFSYLADLLELLSGERARTPVTGWPLCARCWRRSRRARLLTRTLLGTGVVGLVGGLAVGLALRLSTGTYAPTWVMVPILVGFALIVLARAPATVANANRILRAETTRDGALVRFAEPHQEFADRLRALLGDQVRPAHPTDQPVAG
ncbi:MAG: hypothetical protein FWJ70_02500 [Micromonosporaceae bacterium]|jgi:hypothetical protein